MTSPLSTPRQSHENVLTPLCEEDVPHCSPAPGGHLMLNRRASSAMAPDRAQRLRLARVRVGTSPIHGLGLFAVTALTQGTRILPYVGEKLAKEEGARRLAQKNAYIFALNDRYDIDGQTRANTARSINHSCRPNCAAITTTRTIWIVALRDITNGEELSYNYGYGAEDYAQYPCRCGAEPCCGSMLDRRYWDVIKTRDAAFNLLEPVSQN